MHPNNVLSTVNYIIFLLLSCHTFHVKTFGIYLNKHFFNLLSHILRYIFTEVLIAKVFTEVKFAITTLFNSFLRSVQKIMPVLSVDNQMSKWFEVLNYFFFAGKAIRMVGIYTEICHEKGRDSGVSLCPRHR